MIPQLHPLKLFSEYWPISARSVMERSLISNRSVRITPVRTSRKQKRKVQNRSGYFPDYHIKTTCDCMSFFFECPDYTKRIVCPVVFFFICQIIERCFYNIKGVQIHGIKMDLVILSFACGTVSTKCQCTWKYMSTVIICVFTNQIHVQEKSKTSSFGITKSSANISNNFSSSLFTSI